MPRPFVEDDLMAETLFDEPFVAVGGTQSRWARRRRIELAELIGEPWVLPPYDSVPGLLILEIFRAGNLRPPTPSVVTLAVQLTTNLIITGRYVGLLPRSAVQFSGSRAGLKILPVKLADQRTAVGIIMVKNRTVSPLTGLFIGCARQVGKPLEKGK
jgi:DNA-binding transcriptional LysR family regulator